MTGFNTSHCSFSNVECRMYTLVVDDCWLLQDDDGMTAEELGKQMDKLVHVSLKYLPSTHYSFV